MPAVILLAGNTPASHVQKRHKRKKRDQPCAGQLHGCSVSRCASRCGLVPVRCLAQSLLSTPPSGAHTCLHV
eukprot:250757-Chlamydomonas_euryale.AAC.17